MFTGPKIIQDGLILNLDAQNPKSVDTLIWKDLSPNKNNGTLINGPVFNTNSLIFDGVNDNVITSLLITTQSFTYEMWLKWNAINVNKTILSNEGQFSTSTPIAGIGIRQRSSNVYGLARGRSSPVNVSATVPNPTNYHMVTLCVTPTSATFFINGVQSGSTATFTGTWSVTNPIYIGRHPIDGEYFNGNISSCRIYDRVLNLSEIQQNYNTMKSRYI